MSASREGANMWWWLFSRHKYAGVVKFFRRKIWRSPFFWQDSFITPWNRLIGCRLRGHRHVSSIGQLGDDSVPFCFSCYRALPSYEFSKEETEDTNP